MAGWRQVLSSTDTTARVRHAHPGTLRTEMPHVIPGALAHPGLFGGTCRASSRVRLRTRATKNSRITGFLLQATADEFQSCRETVARVSPSARPGGSSEGDAARHPGCACAPGALRREMPHVIPGTLAHSGYEKRPHCGLFCFKRQRRIRSASRNRSPGLAIGETRGLFG